MPVERRDPGSAPTSVRLRNVVPLAVIVLVLAQLIAAQVQFLGGVDGQSVFSPSNDAQVPSSFTSLVRHATPKGATILLFLAHPDDHVYFQLSYSLQPRNRVWYSTPYPSHAPPDWWIRDDGSAPSLIDLAHRLSADYIVFYDTAPPAELQPLVTASADPGYRVVHLQAA